MPFEALPVDFGASAKVEFSAREYAKLLGAHLSGGMHLDLTLIPRLRETFDAPRVRPVPVDEAIPALSGCCSLPVMNSGPSPG
jgi:hypothetical protein